MLEILTGLAVLNLVVSCLLYWMASVIIKLLSAPIPRKVSTRGVELNPALTADYFKMKRDLHAKDSPTWKEYDKRFRELTH